MKTKREIIEEIASFYNLKNRATRPITDAEAYMGIQNLSNEICQYHMTDGRTCAIGRYMNDSVKYANNNESIISISESINRLDGIDSLLIEEVKGHDIMFWDNLQKFHDKDCNWTNEGLSELGLDYKNQLLEMYNEN